MYPLLRTTFFLAILIVLVACNFPTGTTTAAPSPDFVKTAAAQTVEARLTAASGDQTASDTPVPPASTATAEPPTSFPTLTATPPVLTPSNTPPSTQATPDTPCNRGGFVTDVTVPDGTDFLPGESFRKTWRLRNTGSCTWNSSYSLVFISGDAMSGPAATNLTTGVVAPGQEVDISVDLIAPQIPGTYRGNWKLRDPAGVVFGLGANADNLFWVEIEVPGPTETPAPTVTPNPGFNLAYENTHTCAGTAHATFRIANTGNVSFESAEVTIRDMDTPATLYGPTTSNADFMGTANECPPGGEDVRPGITRYLAASLGPSPPTSNNARATLQLCSQNDRGGVCLEKTVDFVIP